MRAKITGRVEDWKWSSARTHARGIPDKAIDLFDWLNNCGKYDYARFVSRDGRDDHIRKATSTGRPLGSLGFLEMPEKQLSRSLRPKRRGRPSTRDKGSCP